MKDDALERCDWSDVPSQLSVGNGFWLMLGNNFNNTLCSVVFTSFVTSSLSEAQDLSELVVQCGMSNDESMYE